MMELMEEKRKERGSKGRKWYVVSGVVKCVIGSGSEEWSLAETDSSQEW